MRGRRISVIGGESELASIRDSASHWPLEIVSCSSVGEARRLLPDGSLSLILCDDNLQDGTYRDVLNLLPKQPRPAFVVISSAATVDGFYDEAIKNGVFDVITRPFGRTDIQWIIIRAMQFKKVE